MTLRALLRAAAFVVSFLGASAMVWVLAELVVLLSRAERQSISLQIVEAMRPWQQAMIEDREHERIAFLGDSVLARAGDPSLPDATEAALRSRGDRHARAAIHTLWAPAWSPVTEYFLANEILRTRPDRIVLEVNLRTLGPTPLEPFNYPELSGWIDARHLPEAMALPLFSEAGLTLNRSLFYQLLVGCHLDELWTHVVDRQARLYNVHKAFEPYLDRQLSRTEYLQRQLGRNLPLLARDLVPGKDRSNAASLRKMLGNALSGIDGNEPRVRILLALIDRFIAAGVPTLVWVAPVNVEHLRSVGIATDGLDLTTSVLYRLVIEHGATFLDFHEVVGDAGFLDHGDHLRFEGRPAPTEVIGTLIAAALARTAPPSSGLPRGYPVSGRDGDAVQ